MYICIFFFKQKTSYELLRSLVGSEMCIRDSLWTGPDHKYQALQILFLSMLAHRYHRWLTVQYTHCLLYTSDAADDLLCVDLGGRRNIKKKKNTYIY